MKIRNKQHRFNFIEPQVIMAVIVSMIILGVGVFAVFTVITTTQDESIGAGGTFSRNFTPGANPNTYNGLPIDTESITSVEEYYDGAWHTVTSGTGYYWHDGDRDTIVVNATGWG